MAFYLTSWIGMKSLFHDVYINYTWTDFVIASEIHWDRKLRSTASVRLPENNADQKISREIDEDAKIFIRKI
jgi:hypothetical protein